jgi:hypothetical protein
MMGRIELLLPRFSPYLLLAGLGLLFFADLVLHPTQVLYSDHSDLLGMHLPAKQFLVSSWQETGELPLWCPYSFAGLPFVHDIMAETFYPPHAPLYWLPVEHLGAALSWLIVAHVIVAGWCMYAYAASRGLGRTGALVAGCGYMFAGKWLLHLLAAAQFITGLAWLPLVLLCLEQAIRRRSLCYATGAGAAYALVILGTHPQWTFYAGGFIALWTLGTAWEEVGSWSKEGEFSWPQTARTLGRWLGYGACAVLVAGALAAVQILPTLEAARYTSRDIGVTPTVTWIETQVTLVLLIGPPLPEGPSALFEFRGAFGLLWIAFAAMAPGLSPSRARFPVIVCLLILVFSLGGSQLVQHLPGFRLFRLPSRMLMLGAFPVSFLAGLSIDALAGTPGPEPALRQRCRRVLLLVVGAVGIVLGCLVLRIKMDGQALQYHPYWILLLATVPTAFWLVGKPASFWRIGPGLLCSLLLLLDLWTAVEPLVAVRPEAEIYAPSASIRHLANRPAGQGRLLDRNLSTPNTPLGSGAPLALRYRIEALRGFNSLDILRYKEYLQFVGGVDEPIRPIESPLTNPYISDFAIKNRSLLDLLGTRYLLQPSAGPVDREDWDAVLVDPCPRAYDCSGGGMQELPSYTVYENRHVLPRAFVVPQAAPLPDRPLQTLAATDFRRRVLLEESAPLDGEPGGDFRPATIRAYQPNRVMVKVDEGPPGYLVLADIWFPGWTCTVDGQPAAIHRADYLFRAVVLPAGAHEVVFTFAPTSYYWGKLISVSTLAAVVAFNLLAWWIRRRRPRDPSARGPARAVH